MSRAPHPAFARLYALGGAPALAAGRFAAAFPALEALARDLGDLELLSERAYAPLVREIDLAALFARSLAAQPAGEIAREAARGIEGPRAVAAPRPPRQVTRPAAVPEGEREKPAEAERTGRRPYPVVPGTREPHPRGEKGSVVLRGLPGLPELPQRERIAAALARYAPAPSAVSSAATAPATERRPSDRDRERRPASGGGNAAATANAQPIVDRRPSPTPVSGPSPAQARAALRARAERAGAPAAFDTQVAAALASPGSDRSDGSVGSDGSSLSPARPELAQAPELSQAPVLLTRVLDRLDSRRARPVAAAPVSEAAAVSRLPGLPTAPPAALRAFPAGDREGAPRGLRRLATLAEAGGTAERQLAAGAAPPAEERREAAALPTAARERLEEDELGRRIGRLLRREAQRQGIDLAEVME
ncbi:MAG TPA: hypothetical protein VF173_28470 [Thermoanaerobaculia bacterium]|nr:hypothetical protein [Thermoanaerobaculia bacterium]